MTRMASMDRRLGRASLAAESLGDAGRERSDRTSPNVLEKERIRDPCLGDGSFLGHDRVFILARLQCRSILA
jgi:hypothetical protein